METPEIELTVQDITQGAGFIKKIVLKSDNPSYNGKTVSYRALNGDEFATAMRKAELSDDAEDLADSFKLLIELGKIGVTTPGIGPKFGTLDLDIILQVGGAIMGSTKPKEKEVRDFSKAAKEKSSA